MEDYCRLCAKDNSEQIDLFLHIDSDLCDLIEKLTSIKVREDDVDMPKMICDDCHSQLVAFNGFMNKCQEGQNFLRSLKPKSASGTSEPYTVLHVDIRRTDELDDDGGKNDIKTEELQAVYTDYEELSESDILLDDDDSLSDTNTLEPYENDESIIDSVVDSVFDSGMASNEEYYEQKFNGDLDPDQYLESDPPSEIPSPNKKRARREFGRQLKCTICSAVDMGPTRFEKHYAVEHGQPAVFKCEHCPVQFENYRSYSRHMVLHMDGPQFECPYCYKKFGQKVTLKNHLTIHEKPKSYVCSVCDKKYRSKTSLSTHAYILHKDTKVKCNICRISFSSSETLQNHIKSYHTSEKEEECNICGKRLASKASLYLHLKQHKTSGTVT